MSHRPARLLAALVVWVAWTAALPAAATAHPLGNFSTNHFIGVVVSPSTVAVDLVVDVAEIPSIALLGRFDTDDDGGLGEAEADTARRALCADRVPEVRVSIDGGQLPLQLIAAGIHERPGAGGLATLRVVCELSAPTSSSGSLVLVVDDAGDPSGIGWREIVVQGDGYNTVPADAGRDVAARLTAYPDALLSQPLAERSATIMLEPGGPALAVAPVPDAWPLDGPGGEVAAGGAGVPGGVAAEIPWLPNLGALTLGSGVLGLLAAAAAGAGHALSPGHGKTVMAVYLVGARGRARHALLLGAAVTASHTVGVLGLAAVVILAWDLLPAQRLYPVLAAASGIGVTVIGAWLLAGCARRLRAERRHAHAHAHGHVHDRGHRRGQGHGHHHGGAPEAGLPGVRGLLAIGLAGGLVPSTAALVLLLAAVAAGQPAYGLGLALAFGAGMAAVLTGIGLAMVHGRDRLAPQVAGLSRRVPVGARLARNTPWAVAVVVLAGGLLLTGQALAQTL